MSRVIRVFAELPPHLRSLADERAPEEKTCLIARRQARQQPICSGRRSGLSLPPSLFDDSPGTPPL